MRCVLNCRTVKTKVDNTQPADPSYTINHPQDDINRFMDRKGPVNIFMKSRTSHPEHIHFELS